MKFFYYLDRHTKYNLFKFMLLCYYPIIVFFISQIFVEENNCLR